MTIEFHGIDAAGEDEAEASAWASRDISGTAAHRSNRIRSVCLIMVITRTRGILPTLLAPAAPVAG
jgi:hypothetical protein